MPEKAEIISALQRSLDNLDVGDTKSNRAWTRFVTAELCKIAKDFGLTTCASGVGDYGEWLYDVTWLEYESAKPTDGLIATHLVAECEWGYTADVIEDFQKLLLARASVRLMVFDGTTSLGSRGIAQLLAEQIRKFNLSQDEDGWLFASWEQSGEAEWSFRYFTIEKGAVKHLPSPS